MNDLALENQLCFPLYAASKEIIKHYKGLLDPLDLTYTQYLVMLVLWEQGTLTVKRIGRFSVSGLWNFDSGFKETRNERLSFKNSQSRGRTFFKCVIDRKRAAAP